MDAIRAPRKAFVSIEGGGHFAVFMKSDAFLNELVARELPLVKGHRSPCRNGHPGAPQVGGGKRHRTCDSKASVKLTEAIATSATPIPQKGSSQQSCFSNQ